MKNKCSRAHATRAHSFFHPFSRYTHTLTNGRGGWMRKRIVYVCVSCIENSSKFQFNHLVTVLLSLATIFICEQCYPWSCRNMQTSLDYCSYLCCVYILQFFQRFLVYRPRSKTSNKKKYSPQISKDNQTDIPLKIQWGFF